MSVGVRAVIRLLLLLAGVCVPALVGAQPRAWLDRDRIAFGETVTLNIQTTGDAAPDYAVLGRDFTVSGRTSQRRFELVGGQARMNTLYGVALRPNREGRLQVPAVPLGPESTVPLSLLVTPATSAPMPTRAGDDVFIESGADDANPYVQQSVGWVVRLYTAVPVVSGQLDQPAPDGASLQRIAEDARYTRRIGAREYTVHERRYLLVPERSGALTMPPAVFEGRGIAGFFDSLFDRDASLAARAPPRVLQVRPVPANAPQPWLPLQDLQLRYVDAPRALWAGRAASVTVEMTADGATAAQMPELQWPPVEGLQVLAEPATSDERFVDGRPRVVVTRRFALVPAAAGPIRLPALEVPWWDVRAGRARVASVAALDWSVQPAAGGAAAAAVGSTAPSTMPAPRDAGALATDGDAGTSRTGRWVAIAAAFAALWLATLAWLLHRRRATGRVQAAGPGKESPASGRARPRGRDFKRVLDTGGLDEVEAWLLASAMPAARDLDELRARSGDPRQRAALDALQRARWGGGDAVAARALLRDAFAAPVRTSTPAARASGPLPPLYPER